MKIAYLFPGQGSQAAGMGKDLYDNFPVAKETFAEADAALGYPLSQLCFEGPEEKLKLTEITQPAILTVSVAAYRVLREKGAPSPAFVAGHSLGEYSAHVASGTLSFADAVKTVRNRGKYMQEAVPVGAGAMAAILGMSIDALEEVCREADGDNPKAVAPANINSPSQIVISGEAAAVQRAADLAKSKGAKRAIMLPVSAPFHCALMQPAQDRLAQDLRQLQFNDAQFPVIKNIDAEPTTSGEQAREAMIRQVTGAVQWVKTVQRLFAEGVTHFAEVGPGKVLCGLTGQVGKEAKREVLCSNVEDSVSLDKTLEFIKG
jgi:[acyl-carrier-protein] S-malonyltransferase